ncbi:SDR family oxidoreductase [Candidatus Pelagibacter sp.]|nr:SDR family oxidoreductase [Candidatus Pelagibacter sp.]
MKKIIIIGGAGYVGVMLAKELLKQNYEVTIFDLLIYGKDVFQNHPKLRIIKGDIRDITLLEKNIPGHDALIHLACISNDPSFELDPKLGKSINFDSFEPLVAISKNNNIKRFIYASSSSVYGVKDKPDVNEKDSCEPITDYSKFKLKCEKILLDNNSENFTTSIIRPATVCGYSPRQRLDLVVNILTNLAYHTRKIKVFGGEQLRPNIHIKDMVSSYILLLKSPINKISGEIFNVGFENLKVKDIALKVKKIVGEDVTLNTEASNDNRSYHISATKIMKNLGFKPKYTIEDAIIELVKKFKEEEFKDTLANEFYFNIKRMQNIKLI